MPSWRDFLNSEQIAYIGRELDSSMFGSEADPESIRGRWANGTLECADFVRLYDVGSPSTRVVSRRRGGM